MKPLRCAVIGTGHLGKIHAGLVHALQTKTGKLALQAVVDSDSNRAQQVASLFHVEMATDISQVISDIDAAIVATPTISHLEIGSQLLKAGKHCFIEKPMALDMLQCKALNRLAEDNSLILQVGHVECFNPVWRGLRSQFGHVQFIDAVRCGTYTGRSTDIGIVMDLMIHDLDLIAEVVNSEVERISAFSLNVLSQHEDFAEAHLRFRNGTVARVRASRIDTHTQRNFSVYSDRMIAHLNLAEGSASVSQLRCGAQRSMADTLPYDQRLKVKDSLFTKWLPTQEISFASENSIEQELLNFADSIQNHQQPIVDGTRGQRAVTMAEQVLAAAKRSQEEKFSAQDLDLILPFPQPQFTADRIAA